jgi:hypothetical protein
MDEETMKEGELSEEQLGRSAAGVQNVNGI